MKRSRPCAVLLAAAVASIHPISLLSQSAPTTQPAATLPSTAPIAATTQSAATQTAASMPSTAPTIASTMPATAPSTQVSENPADHPPGMIRLNFRDVPLDTILERLSQDAGFAVIKDVPVDVRVSVMSLQPLTPAQAVTLLNAVLDGNGLAALQNDHTLRIVAREKAKKGNLPVHFGADPAQVEAADSLITQVIPLINVDAVKLRQDLTPLIGPDADVTANAGANAIVMTDTSANVKRIVEIISILDKKEGTTSEVKIIPLKNANASAAAKLVLAIFRPEEPKLPKGAVDPAALQQHHEGRLLGTGVDQALHGGKVTASADERTNSVIVAAPSATMIEIVRMLKEIDDNPVTVTLPSIKTFHLKVADASEVARAIRLLFRSSDDDSPTQSHQVASDEAFHTHVIVVYEERTNTVIVTATPAAMAIAEKLIADIDARPVVETTVKSFPLKFADAPTTARLLLSIFTDPQTGQARLQGALRDKVGVSSDLRTNTVFVTASPENMKLVENAIKDVDASPTSGAGVKFFHLKQADADATAKLIINFFKPPETGPEKKLTDAVHFGVNAVADPRTNTVAVTAPDEAMKVVEQIVKEVENDASSTVDIQTFTLKNGDASTVAKLLTSVFQPDQGAAAPTKSSGKDLTLKAKIVAAADDRTNTVVVTAPADTLKVIESIVKLLDANPASEAQIQVFQLKNADPERAATLLESIFQPPSLSSVGSGTGTSTGPKPPGEIDAVRKLGWIATTSDERTNTLIVTAPPEVLKVVQGILEHLDSNPASQETFFLYRLRNGQAQNLQVVLNQLFGNTALGGTGAATLGGQNGIGRAGVASPTAAAAGFGGAGGGRFGGTGLGAGAGAFGSTAGAGGTGIGARRATVSTASGLPGAGIGGATGQLSAGSSRVLSELSGQVFVVADLDTNSLLVTTATRFEREVRQIISELDRAVPQVLIKVLVAEVSHDNNADWGTDFSILNRRSNGNGIVGTQSLGNAAVQAANGGLVVNLVENNVNVTLHALATEGKLDVLSRPYILASDNQLASITVGQEVPFITNTQITDTGQQINTITYQDVGIILNVTPHINPEGLVILDVAPEISQLTGTTVPISNGVAAPVIAKRSAQSRVGIKNGQTIVIGGLMEDRKTDTISKIPILGDIPFIGEAFRRTQTDKTKTELLIFLTPHVAQQPETLDPMTRDEVNGTRLTPGAVGPGTFEEHMTGMRRGKSPDSQPSTAPVNAVVEFNSPTTQPSESSTKSSTPIRLPP